MHKFLICTFLFLGIELVFISTSLAQKKKREIKLTDIYNLFQPPNGVQIKDSLFIDATEVANIHWLEYSRFTIKDIEFYLSQLPDTTLLKDCPIIQNDTMDYLYLQNYHRYPYYRFHPVIGVSYEQAVNFCKWRSKSATEFVNEIYPKKRKIPSKKRKILRNYKIEFEYRLPTKEEWELAAGNIDTILKSKRRKRRVEENDLKRWKKLFNADTCFNVEWIYMSAPSKKGLYNMFGNVAEMIQEKGIAKGGHNMMNIKDIVLKKDYVYDRPKKWLGFRCVAIVKVIPKNKVSP